MARKKKSNPLRCVALLIAERGLPSQIDDRKARPCGLPSAEVVRFYPSPAGPPIYVPLCIYHCVNRKRSRIRFGRKRCHRLPPESPLLTAAEAAAYLRVPLRTLRQYVAQRRLAFVKFGRRLVFRQADLDAFIQRHTARSRQHRARV